MPITVRFPDYAFNKNIENCFHEWNVFLIRLFYDTKIKEHVSFESREKKQTFACAMFGKIYVASAINRAG